MLLVGLATRVSAAYGMSLLGVGDAGDLAALTGGGSGGGSPVAGSLSLRPDLLRAVALGGLWGAVAGFVGSLPATRINREAALPPR
jgi:hypothetical protein